MLGFRVLLLVEGSEGNFGISILFFLYLDISENEIGPGSIIIDIDIPVQEINGLTRCRF